MSDVVAISVPITWIGSVNLWLLRGEQVGNRAVPARRELQRRGGFSRSHGPRILN